MKNVLLIFLIYCFSLTIISCSSDSGGGSSSTTPSTENGDGGTGDGGTGDGGTGDGGDSGGSNFSIVSCNTSTTNCNVTGDDPQSISICPDSLTIGKGAVQKFTLIGTYANSCKLDLTSFAWWLSSDNSSFGNNGGSSSFTALATSGTVTVTATYGTRDSTSQVTLVEKSITSLVVSPNIKEEDRIGRRYELTATGTFSDSSTEDLTDNASWYTKNSAYATVSNSGTSGRGIVTIEGVGTTVITAAYENVGDTHLMIGGRAIVATTLNSIYAGARSVCGLIGSSIKCWGRGSFGRLGNGSTLDNATPVTVSGISNAVQVGSGLISACAVLDTGSVQCWGRGSEGRMGNGANSDQSTPVSVSGISTATQVAVGHAHSCARLSDSTVKCWGRNGEGQLGNNSTTGTNTPVSVSGISNATEVRTSGTWMHSCARLSDGTVKCWGKGGDGQLGNGSDSNQSIPVDVSGISNATQVALGARHSCALLIDSTVKCWGFNSLGQLGDGSTTSSNTPVSVSGLTNVTQISILSYHNCALLIDQTVKCWGSGGMGALGNSSNNYSSVPISVGNLSGVVEVSAGESFTCVRKSDNTIWCWGGGRNYGLGNGDTLDRWTPVQVGQ